MPSEELPLPSKAQYVAALTAVLPRLSEPQLKMLRAHYQAPDVTITTHDLALAAGFVNWKPVNMHYGLVGSYIRSAIGPAGDVRGQRSYVFAYFIPPTAESPGWRWVLHPPVRDALHELACFDEQLLGAGVSDSLAIAAREGAQIHRLVVHRHRENALRLAKLESVRKAHSRGRLICEVPGCGFDFEATYGAIGSGYAEVHHRTPLASFTEETTTTLDELAVVCSNCHRMIHRGGECRELASLLLTCADA